MIRFCRVVCVLLLFTTSVLASRKDSTITTSDGVSLAISYFTPSTPMPAKGYPTILCVHGFGGSRDDYAPIATLYNSFGYLVVTYTARGQGIGAATGSQSGGLFNWFTGDRELKDVAEILGWMRAKKEIDSAHIGMEGMSQGGLTTWGAAINRLPIKCAVPIIANVNYGDNFTANGCINYDFAIILNYAQSAAKVNLGKFMTDTLIPALTNDNYNYTRSLLQARDLKNVIPSINVPLFLQCSWYDQLFGSNYDLNCFNKVATPKKLLMWAGDHSLPPSQAVEDARRALTIRFYNRWLREDTSETIMSKDSTAIMFNPNNTGIGIINDTSLKTNLLKPTTALRFYLAPSGKITVSYPKDSMVVRAGYIQNFTNDNSISFISEAFDSDFTMFRAGVHFSLTSTATLFQANPMIYDVDDTGRTIPITRGYFEERPNGPRPSTPLAREFEMNSQFHVIKKGHRIRLIVKFGMPIVIAADEFGQSPYPPQESATNSLFSTKSYPSYVILSPLLTVIPRVVDTTGDTTHSIVRDYSTREQPKPSIAIVQGDQLPISDNATSIELCDLIGQVVFQMTLQTPSRSMFDTRSLSPGVYFLREECTQHTTIQKIIVLQAR